MPIDSAASIVVFEHPVIAQDCVDALQVLGFTTTYLPLTEDNVMALMTARPDYVLTINFNQFISQVCELLKIAYLSWVVDTPCYSIYDKAVSQSCSFTFLYDAAIAQRLRSSGVRQVYHLPLAANLDRIGMLQSHSGDPARDVTFVANLTRTEYRTHIMPRLSAATKAHCAQLIDCLDQPCDTFRLAEQIEDSLIDAVMQESGYQLVGDHYLTVAEKLAYLLGREHSWQERINFVNALERRLQVGVYGNTEWHDVIGCYAGHADHFSEMPTIFRTSKINLNLSRSFVEYGLPMRIFDVLSCGGFLVTNDKADLQKLFTADKDLVIFRDVQDLTEICAYYLEHEEQRKAIAEQGRITVARDHTYVARLTNMFTTVQRVRRGDPMPLSRWYA